MGLDSLTDEDDLVDFLGGGAAFSLPLARTKWIGAPVGV